MDDSRWTLFSNHAHVLFCLHTDPWARHRDLAVRVGVTERAAQRIVAELIDAGFVSFEHVGRRNHYRVNRDAQLRHPLEAHRTVGELVDWLSAAPWTSPDGEAG
jgi:hypothetical protein